MAVGASFSALEVIPLVLIGFEAYQTYRLQNAAPWMRRYKWPVLFFVGVAFWNLGRRSAPRPSHRLSISELALPTRLARCRRTGRCRFPV
jgi:hypothetical protein